MKNRNYLTIGELSAFLGWSPRFIERLAHGEKLPGLEIDGQWRFSRAEIVDWLDRKIQTLDVARLAELEEKFEQDLVAEGVFKSRRAVRVSSRLHASGIALDAPAKTKTDIILALVAQAERTGRTLDSRHLYASILEREGLCSTALPGGIAICHPRRPTPTAIKDDIVVFVRAAQPISFGAENGESTRLFFLLCSQDDAAHLHGLSRLARLLDSVTLAELHNTVTSPAEVIALLTQREDAVTRQLERVR